MNGDFGGLDQIRLISIHTMTIIALPDTNFVVTRYCALRTRELFSSIPIHRLQADIISMLCRAMTRSVRTLVATPCKLDETIEDAEFELELDAVNQRLPGCLNVEEVREFESEDGDGEEDDEDVDDDQVIEYHFRLGVADTLLEPQAFGSLPDVKA